MRSVAISGDNRAMRSIAGKSVRCGGSVSSSRTAVWDGQNGRELVT
uniref:Uncharacterized protein n=1 Tax=Anguilla anguilla TaxID=7936 RepID=A0A0E9S3R2_ANGAN